MKKQMSMRRWVMALLVLCLAGGLAYAGWVPLGGDEKAGMTIYIDASAIARHGDHRTVWVLYDFKTAQTKEGGLSFLSAKMQREYNCAKAQTRILSILHYEGAMESGNMVLESKPTNQDWAPVGQLESGTIAKDLWTLACSEG